MAELTMSESEKLHELFITSYEHVYSKLSDKWGEFGIKRSITPDNFCKELLEDEFKVIGTRLVKANVVFRYYIEIFLEEWNNNKNGDEGSEKFLEAFMVNFIGDEYLEKYVNYDYKTINWDIEEEDPNLPFFSEMINVLAELDYYTSVRTWYDQGLEEGFKNTTQFVIKGKSTNFNSTLTLNQYKYLYKELTQTHHCINEFKTSEMDFINVFTKKFDEHDSKIYFTEETTQVAYIFYLLKPHFTYLYKCIQESKKFITKNNTIFRSNNISSQLDKTVKKGIPVKNTDIIDQILNNLQEL